MHLTGASSQFTAKQLEKLAKKAEKDSKAEQAKVKKVKYWLCPSLGLATRDTPLPWGSASTSAYSVFWGSGMSTSPPVSSPFPHCRWHFTTQCLRELHVWGWALG